MSQASAVRLGVATHSVGGRRPARPRAAEQKVSRGPAVAEGTDAPSSRPRAPGPRRTAARAQRRRPSCGRRRENWPSRPRAPRRSERRSAMAARVLRLRRRTSWLSRPVGSSRRPGVRFSLRAVFDRAALTLVQHGALTRRALAPAAGAVGDQGAAAALASAARRRISPWQTRYSLPTHRRPVMSPSENERIVPSPARLSRSPSPVGVRMRICLAYRRRDEAHPCHRAYAWPPQRRSTAARRAPSPRCRCHGRLRARGPA